MKREVEENCLKLSITEGGKAGKNKAVTSCKYLEESFQKYSEEGVVMATSVETSVKVLRTRSKQLGAKEKTRRKSAR